MQTIYFDTFLGPNRAFCSTERLYAPCGYHLDTISYSKVAICFNIKNGIGVLNDFQKAATTIKLYAMPRNVVGG